MLVFEGEQHVGQLQFRPYIPQTRSPKGLFDPLYWMDFKDRSPVLPEKTLALFCYHVGQLDNTTARDARYFGRGIGIQLMEKTVIWAAASSFEALVAKGLPNIRPVIEFMGGLPAETYQQNGFRIADRYVDHQLRTELERMMNDPSRESLRKALMDTDLNEASTICICVKDL
jgi:hypothetical protein